MMLNPWFWLALIVYTAGLWMGGVYKGTMHERARIAAEAAKHAEKVTHATDEVVTDYVTRIENLPDLSGDALARRVCPDRDPGVPRASRPAPTPAPASRDRLAADLRSCKANTEQLAALISAVKANNNER